MNKKLLLSLGAIGAVAAPVAAVVACGSSDDSETIAKFEFNADKKVWMIDGEANLATMKALVKEALKDATSSKFFTRTNEDKAILIKDTKAIETNKLDQAHVGDSPARNDYWDIKNEYQKSDNFGTNFTDNLTDANLYAFISNNKVEIFRLAKGHAKAGGLSSGTAATVDGPETILAEGAALFTFDLEQTNAE